MVTCLKLSECECVCVCSGAVYSPVLWRAPSINRLHSHGRSPRAMQEHLRPVNGGSEKERISIGWTLQLVLMMCSWPPGQALSLSGVQCKHLLYQVEDGQSTFLDVQVCSLSQRVDCKVRCVQANGGNCDTGWDSQVLCAPWPHAFNLRVFSTQFRKSCRERPAILAFYYESLIFPFLSHLELKILILDADSFPQCGITLAYLHL